MRASNPPVLPPSPPPPPQPPSPSPPSPPPTIALQPAPLLAPLHRHHRRPCCDHHHTSTPFTTRLPQHSHHYSCCEHHHHEHTLRCMTTTAVPSPTPLQKAPAHCQAAHFEDANVRSHVQSHKSVHASANIVTRTHCMRVQLLQVAVLLCTLLFQLPELTQTHVH